MALIPSLRLSEKSRHPQNRLSIQWGSLPEMRIFLLIFTVFSALWVWGRKLSDPHLMDIWVKTRLFLSPWLSGLPHCNARLSALFRKVSRSVGAEVK